MPAPQVKNVFRAILDATPDGMIAIDNDGRIRLINDRITAMFGYPETELIGQPIEILIPAALRDLHAKHRAHYVEVPRHRHMGIGLELNALHQDGHAFPVEVSLNPAQDMDSVSVFCAIRDITDRREAERAQRESEARFRNAFDHSPIGFALVSPEGRWLQANQSMTQIVGYTQEELLSLNFQTITHPDDLQPDLDLVAQALKGEIDTFQMEKRYFHKRGHLVDVLLSVSLVRDSEGTPLHFISQVIDITERKRDERQRAQLVADLQRANQDLQNFASVISHDLKAPLRGINGAVSWLALDYAGAFDDAGREMLTLIRERVQRMEEMINGVLSYSRAGLNSSEMTRVDIGEMVAEVRDLLNPPPDVQIRITTGMPTVTGNPTTIRQVFQNLLDNAIKFLDKPESVIEIACERKENEWLITVRDNGRGIEPRHFETIFQMFFTVSSHERKDSSGVGLAVVKRIVERWRGRIWVESQVGQGSTFFFTIPLD